MTTQETTRIQANPSRFSDQSAHIEAGLLGTGAVVIVRCRGQRGGDRVEQLKLTNSARCALIVALGGRPEQEGGSRG